MDANSRCGDEQGHLGRVFGTKEYTGCGAQPPVRDRRAERLPAEREKKKVRTGWYHGT